MVAPYRDSTSRSCSSVIRALVRSAPLRSVSSRWVRHLDAHAQDAQRVEQGRRYAHVEEYGLRKAPDPLLSSVLLRQSSPVLLPTTPSVELRPPPGYTSSSYSIRTSSREVRRMEILGSSRRKL